MKEKTVFEKDYSDESLYDLLDDVSFGMDDEHIPRDKNGLREGTFRVTITWIPDNV
jgi:hypothetical protein